MYEYTYLFFSETSFGKQKVIKTVLDLLRTMDDDEEIRESNTLNFDGNIPHLDMSPLTFMRKSTMLYGESKTGKSVIIYNIFKIIQKYIPLIVVISPTAASNGDYDGRVPSTLIYKEATKELLQNLYNRQEAAALFYRKANKIEHLRKLYDRINDPKLNIMINNIIAKRYKTVRLMNQQLAGHPGKEDKINEVSDAFEEALRNIFRSCIRRHKPFLLTQSLSDDEKYSLKYLDFVPDMCLVMDDCAAQIKQWGKDETIGKIFFQGRHNYITSIYTFQHDKLLEPTYRGNAFTSIFTSIKVASAFIKRDTNNFDPDEQKIANKIIHKLFKNPKKHQKFVYAREAKVKFQYVKADIFPKFKVCFPSVWRYCERVKSDEERLDEDNPFMKNFMLGQIKEH